MSAPDRGSASVYAVALAMIGMLTCVVVLQVTALARVQHRASAAADLAALAAAQATRSGGDGCAAADRIARLNGTALDDCDPDGLVVTVAVVATSPRMWGRRWRVQRTARAGPATYTPAAESSSR